ncbi:Lrp/AsnC family transcriptional regulator [Kineococcus gynurae]|uniref:Lrp/AsnC family transcriptional regulator n=1 Tax=Kineococcus gynurae TaxID=452979 RepID=A0ABV5LPM9_9ACTN
MNGPEGNDSPATPVAAPVVTSSGTDGLSVVHHPTPEPTAAPRRPGPVTLDELDLDLVAALQVAPRAPFNVLADALGSSASTIGRRLTRLQDERILLVVGQIEWSLVSDTHPQHIWIRTRPGTADQVAAALAELPETQFVASTAGRADVHLTVHARARSDVQRLIQAAGAVPGVRSTHSELVLRAVTRPDAWRLHRLGEEQLAILAPEVPPAPGTTTSHELTTQERAVARLLHADGRIAASEVGRLLGLSRSSAHRIVQSLLHRGVVRPRVEVEPQHLGFAIEVAVQLEVRPGATTALAEWCAAHPSARYVSVVAGAASIVHQGVFRDEESLAAFLEHDLADLDGLVGWDVSVVLDVLQRYFIRRERGLISGEVTTLL